MKLQNLSIILIIVLIPIIIVMSVYIKLQTKTITIQTSYNSKLIDSTYDALKAFSINTIQDNYSATPEAKRRDIKAAINTFFTSLGNNLGVDGYTETHLKPYIPAIVFTLYDGYYIYSPVYTGQIDASANPIYDYILKPYTYYSAHYKNESKKIDVVINYTLDNYIRIYGTVNNEYINEAGWLIDEDEIILNTTGYEQEYFNKAQEFTNNSKVWNILSELSACDIQIDENNTIINTILGKIFNEKNFEDPTSNFQEHKRQVIQNSIQSNLTDAITQYSKHAKYNCQIPVLSPIDWDKIVNNVCMISFMQGIPIGMKRYNDYAILTSVYNNEYVDPEEIYFLDNNTGIFHSAYCAAADGNITGHRSVYFQKWSENYTDSNGLTKKVYKYRTLEKEDGAIVPITACYKCVLHNSINKALYSEQFNVEYFKTLARERYKLINNIKDPKN